MQRCAFTPYEGKKPYIFISYAHKDSHLVFPILEELDRQGYRVWYDDGIAPGSEWPENIAQHLDGCSLMLAFISPNSIASANCRREVTFALAKHKPFLGIMLQETEMSLGMEMQLSAQQCIMKYAYATDADFFRKLCSCPDMEPCLGQPKIVTPPAPNTDTSAAPVAEATPAPRHKVEKKPMNKKLLGIVAGTVAAVVLIAIALVIALGGIGNGNRNPDTNSPTDTVLSYSNQTITGEDVAHINRQTQLQTLKIHNCEITGNALDALVMPETVTEISLESCTGVSNLAGLTSPAGLVTLRLTDCGITDADLSALPGGALQKVDISGNPNFTNLRIFANCTKLESIDFSNTGVSSLDTLAGLEHLLAVNGSCTKVTDLTAVAGLTELRELSFADCQIADIEAPLRTIYLETLDLSHNKLTSLSAIANCTVLKHVNLSFNSLYDLEGLEKSAATLVSLNVAGNLGISDSDVAFLNNCPQLRQLTLDGLYLTDLSFLSDLKGLEYLSAVDCSIRDISKLEKLTDLDYLNLSSNRFSDISVLVKIAKDSMYLDLSFNDSLTDVSALPAVRYSYLNLVNGQLEPHTVPAVYGDVLLIYYHEDWLNTDCMNEENRDTFGQIVMIGCPLDKVVAAEKRFGKDRLHLIEEMTAYLKLLEELDIDTDYLASAMKG
ncbi:MAG: TIR domain-containing protein [Ruminococcaceae bacterium]|nr:TIR domain-containing protein [Oscillospiraceae bacterium]